MDIKSYENALKSINSNEFLSEYNSVQKAAIGWDLGALDYNASGIEGWKNRAIGLTSFLNPIAWKDTWEGTVKRNQYANKNANFVESAWNNISGYAGAGLTALGQGVSMPEPIVTGALLSIGSGIDELTDAITGDSDPDTFLDKLKKSWDLNIINNWNADESNGQGGRLGIGDSLVYIFGSTFKPLTSGMNREELKSLGLQFMDSTFDIFDPTQQEDIRQHLFAPLQRTANFAGEWMLDVFSFIPGGAIAKGMRLTTKGAANTALDFERLLKATKGEQSVYSPVLRSYANSTNEWEIANLNKSLGIKENLPILNKFLLNAKTEEEAAHVFLAAEYKNKESMRFLYNKLDVSEKHWGLALDLLNEGGTNARMIRSGKFGDVSLLSDDAFNASYIEALDSLIDSAKLSDEAQQVVKQGASDLLDLTTKIEGTERVVVRAAVRDYGLKVSAFGAASIHWKSQLLNEDTFLKTIQYTANVPGLPTLIRLIRKAPMASYKGFIDPNMRDVALTKIQSKLAEIDSISKGKFAQSGRLQELSTKIINAKSNNDFIKVAAEIEEAGLRAVAEKFGLKDMTKVDAFVKNMIESHKGMEDRLLGLMTFKRKYHDIVENTVYVGDLAKGLDSTAEAATISGNRFFSLDLMAINNALYREGAGSLGNLMDLAVSTKDLLNKTAILWTKAILLRPARFPRERLANLPGLILSGNIYDIFLSKNAAQAISNAFTNAPFRMRRAIDRVQLRQELTGSVFGDVSTQIRNTDLELEQTNYAIAEFEKIRARTDESDAIAAGYGIDDPAAEAAYLETQRLKNTQDVHRDVDGRIHETQADALKANNDRDFNGAVPLETVRSNAKGTQSLRQQKGTNDLAIDKNKATIAKKKAKLDADAKTAQTNLPKVYEDIDKEFPMPGYQKADVEYRLRSGLYKDNLKARLNLANNADLEIKLLGILTKDTDEKVRVAAIATINKKRDAYLKNKNGVLNSDLNKTKAEVEALEAENIKLEKQNKDIDKQLSDITESPTLKRIKEEYGAALKNGDMKLWVFDSDTGIWRKTQLQSLKGKSLKGLHVKVADAGWKPATKTVKKDKVYGTTLEINKENIDEIAKELKTTPEDIRKCFKESNACSGSDAPIWPLLASQGIGAVSYIDNLGRTVTQPNHLLTKSTNETAAELALEAERKKFKSTTDKEAAANSYDIKIKSTQLPEDAEAYDLIQKINNFKNSANSEGYANFVKKHKETVDKLKRRRAALQAKRNRYTRYVQDTKTTKTAGISEGQKTYKGQTYDNYGEGSAGKYSEARINPQETWKEVHDMDRMAEAVYNNQTGSRLADLLPGDKDYYDGLAAVLQVYGRNDEIFTMLAKGKTELEVIDWLKKTSAGKEYARARNIGKGKDTVAAIKGKTEEEIGYAQTFEEYISDKKDFLDKQLALPELKEYFLSGEKLSGANIAEMFKGREHLLLPITARVFMPGEVRKATRVVGKFFDDFNRLVVENPQQVLENVPLATAYYNETMKKLLDANIEKYGRDLTVAEINALSRQARSDSERHVRKWLYNVQTKTNFSEALSIAVPFISAYTFTVKSMIKGITENPAAVLWMLSGLNKTSYSLNWVDAEGNPTNNLFEARSLIIPIPEVIKTAVKGTFLGSLISDESTVSVSARSLNVWFGGEVMPGPNPLVTIPVSELVKGNPTLANKINEATKKFMFLVPDSEGLIDWLLPMGPSSKPFSYDQLLPTGINVIADMGLFTKLTNPDYRGQQYVDAVGKIMAYESAKARAMGPEYPLPDPAEVEARVDALFGLKILSAFFGPASWNIKSEADMARTLFNQYRTQYGEDAEWKFLSEHPEMLGGMVSSSSNRYQMSADAVTVENLSKYPDIVDTILMGDDGSKGMLGFFMNTSGDAEFNDYAYTALQTMTPGVGEDAYLGKISPAEVARKSAARVGWIYFNKLSDAIDAEALEKGIDPSKDLRLIEYKKISLAALKEKYPEWYSEYMKRDAYQYTDRANTVDKLLENKNFVTSFGDKSFINSLAIFSDNRQLLIDELEARREKGMSGGIESESNQDIKQAYNQLIFQLKSESNRFSDFYNRFFDGDSLIG